MHLKYNSISIQILFHHVWVNEGVICWDFLLYINKIVIYINRLIERSVKFILISLKNVTQLTQVVHQILVVSCNQTQIVKKSSTH